MGLVLLACGGHSTHEGYDAHHGGATGSEAGAPAGGALAAAGSPADMGNAGDGDVSATGGASASGGASATGTAGAAVGGAPSAGQGGSAGESFGGAGGQGGAPVIDHSRARFPIPNSVYSGLPHPISYDLGVPGVVHDNVTGLTWQDAVLPTTLSWKDGVGYCDTLALAGKDDWRLPARIELLTLMAAVEEYNGVFPLTGPTGGYWSSSLVADDYDMTPWVVWLGYDYDFSFSYEKMNVRCVRSDDTLADPTPTGFIVMGDVVKDTGTGLTWERSPLAVWRTRADSFGYCKNLKLGGIESGWRLSSMPELLTLPGLEKQFPRTDATLFPDVDSVTYGWFWTATVYRIPSSTGQTEIPSFNLGSGSHIWQYDDEAWLVRCVHD